MWKEGGTEEDGGIDGGVKGVHRAHKPMPRNRGALNLDSVMFVLNMWSARRKMEAPIGAPIGVVCTAASQDRTRIPHHDRSLRSPFLVTHHFPSDGLSFFFCSCVLFYAIALRRPPPSPGRNECDPCVPRIQRPPPTPPSPIPQGTVPGAARRPEARVCGPLVVCDRPAPPASPTPGPWGGGGGPGRAGPRGAREAVAQGAHGHPPPPPGEERGGVRESRNGIPTPIRLCDPQARSP